jgi:hypothetical protein
VSSEDVFTDGHSTELLQDVNRQPPKTSDVPSASVANRCFMIAPPVTSAPAMWPV